MEYHFVTPDNRNDWREHMHDFFSRSAEELGENAIDKYDTQNARYLVCVHKEYGVIGGLRLLSSTTPRLSDRVLKQESKVSSDVHLWEISKLYFHLPPSSLIHSSPMKFDKLCRKFYTDIWEILSTSSYFGALISLLPVEEHRDVSYFGKWRFNDETLVDNPYCPGKNQEDQYVFGVLIQDNVLNIIQ